MDGVCSWVLVVLLDLLAWDARRAAWYRTARASRGERARSVSSPCARGRGRQRWWQWRWLGGWSGWGEEGSLVEGR